MADDTCRISSLVALAVLQMGSQTKLPEVREL